MKRSRLLSRIRELTRDDVARREDERRPAAGPPHPHTARPRSPAADTTASGGKSLPALDLQRLEAEARYHRDRLALYRARVHSAKPTSATRLRELQRTSAAADARLRHARGPSSKGPDSIDSNGKVAGHGPL